MNVVFIGIVIVVLLIGLYYYFKKEAFSMEFEASMPGTEYMIPFDMPDHQTIVRFQRGNNGNTVLILHTSPMDITMWDPLFQTMQSLNMNGVKTPNLVAYDLRGFGSAWMPVPIKYADLDPDNHIWSFDQYVEDCERIHKNVIGLENKIIIAGFGIGGGIAMKYALKFPERLKKLVVLQTSVKPVQFLQSMDNRFAGPNGWIAKNPDIPYLTGEKSFIDGLLNGWFYIPEEVNTVQFLIGQKLLRQGSLISSLQVIKLLLDVNFYKEWSQVRNIPYMIHLLAATDDPLVTPEEMTQTFSVIYNNNRNVQVVFDIVKGRHAFTLIYSGYIANILYRPIK